MDASYSAAPACVCCGHALVTGLEEWHRVCARCGYESAQLAPSINESAAHENVDEATRHTGLKALRAANFRQLLDRISRHASPDGARRSILDVGAAHGWFVKAAADRQFDALGLEPDHAVCAGAQRTGARVREGYFPDALAAHEKFDVIVFNDVFEHIPALDVLLAHCSARLNPGGLLVLNLPSSRGIFYRASKVLHRMGAAGFFERLWQKSLPSPHLHYFHAHNLAQLCSRHGLTAVESFHLASIHLDGLYARIAYVKSGLRWLAPLIWLSIVLAYPLVRWGTPSDIDVVIFRPESRQGPGPTQ